MTKYRIVGDVHGKWDRYKKLIKDATNSIVVGDFGVGFSRWDWHQECRVPLANPPYDNMSEGNHRFIRGNHDSPIACSSHPYWIPDGTIETTESGKKIMYIGGALSVDKAFRTENLDWWADEELSYYKLQEYMDLYLVEKPDVLITHDTVESFAVKIEEISGRKKLDIDSRTRQAFQSMFEIYQPEIWICGHWHVSIDTIFNGTRFIVLDELGYIDLDI
jgi:hypothetical protein